MYYVYILKSKKTGRLYKGFTKDLRKRIIEHNKGKTISSKFGIPWKIAYYEAFENEKDARREELFLKSGKGRERIKNLFENSD
ncbi:MAG: GIY-YIG nuclease family protein [Candidatus Paceibacterota bacterium]|jgi:putative endonuclease